MQDVTNDANSDYEMDQVILDLVSDVNVLLKQTWERMDGLAFKCSLIQL